MKKPQLASKGNATIRTASFPGRFWPRNPGTRPGSLIVLFFLSLTLISPTFGADKVIRLRNETIITSSSTSGRSHAQALDEPVSGLYLIQFTNHFQQAWLKTLRGAHVELLQNVPEDGFIASVSGEKLSSLHALPFVEWIGKFKPAYKMQKSLEQIREGERKPVSVLLAGSPEASGITSLRRGLRSAQRLHAFESGSIMELQASREDIQQLSESSLVLWIEPAPHMQLLDEVADQIAEGPSMNHQTEVQTLGYDGSGVAVAVADSGLNNGDAATMHPDLAGRVDSFLFYGTLTNAADEHSHGTHVTGIVAGNGATGEVDDNGLLYGLGMAPNAHIVAQRIFDGDGNFQAPPSYETLTHDATRAGAVIGSNSWGDDTQGRYDMAAMEFDATVRDADENQPGDQPFILTFSAGNAGPASQTIASPAVAKNVIAIGASENNRLNLYIFNDGIDTMADFSSRGPTEDGRIKPDVVAPGTWISSLRSASSSPFDENAWASISPNYIYVGGTSQAVPHVSGGAAVFVQYYRQSHSGATPSPALVKAALINSAADMSDSAGTGSIPNNDEGWGRLNLATLLDGGRKFEFLDQTNLLATGQTFEKHFFVGPDAMPLKVTLAYTDVPAFPGAIPALVNDLDLELVSPSGNVYHGNQFLNGESVPNSNAHDSLNNVEGIHLAAPIPGEYILRVHAVNIPQDARRDTPGIDQDFALVLSGDLPVSGFGFVVLDRKTYTAPGQINLTLVDTDLAGRSSASVIVSNLTSPQGISLTLEAVGTSGVFSGVVGTARSLEGGSTLRLGDGDLIEAIYSDQSSGRFVIATARADLISPVITDVAATNRFASETITWHTDEPASSMLICLTNGGISGVFTNGTLDQTHSITIKQPSPGVLFQYYVVSVDEAGNAGTNDNNSQFYSFLVGGVPTVLLVDDYVSDGITDDIPVTAYTDALDQTGVSYDVWNVSQNGSPASDDLKPYRVVIWRINDSFFDSTSIVPEEQGAIEQYLGRGGAFMMSSMEILTRLGAIEFRTNVLQVQQFTSGCTECDEDYTVPSIQGSALDSVAPGVSVQLDYSAYPTDGQTGPDLSDTFTSASNSVPFLFEPVSGRTVGVRFPRIGQDSHGRVVFMSFPLDSVPMDGDPPNNRSSLLKSILAFLAPGLNGVASITLNNAEYTAPSQVTIEVGDSDLSAEDTVTIQVQGDSSTFGQDVRLQSTAVPGLFRGFFSLTTNTAPSAGELFVRNHDMIHARYHDTSPNEIVEAAAIIDLDHPVISNLFVNSSYQEANISWDTSEAADALVQFGESSFLGRTAYGAQLLTSRKLTVPGLQPGRVYYFQLVSRDSAGNTAVDDNQGQLYSFNTSKPLLPPWSDDFENGSTNWTVQEAGQQTSNTRWEFGQPSNGLGSVGHSGSNVWGMNLRGAEVNKADSILVSPEVFLIGGTHATLHFWQNYDFTADPIEFGQLRITTDLQGSSVPLDQFDNSSSGWKEMEYDLTPYVGSTIQLSWEYTLLDLEQNSHPGWLIDDVSISITNEFTGTVTVTNNLAAATFTISGASNYNGFGRFAILSNAPAGDYVIDFNPVPYYTTPPSLTNSLSITNGTINWTGIYTFPDANANRISDLWEQQFFGMLLPNNGGQTDFDEDGASDYTEFIAGTDPTDAGSIFELSPSILMLPDSSVSLQWNSVSGRTYRVFASPDIINWAPITDSFNGNDDVLTYTVPPDAQLQVRFFKVEVAP